MNINFGEKDPRILEKMFENMLDKYPEGLNECPLSQEEMDNVLKAVSKVLKHQYKIDFDDTGYDDRYNDGLKDAREIIIKLHTMSPIVRKKIFNEDYVKEILLTHTVKEIDEKMKTYEQEQNRIQVGEKRIDMGLTTDLPTQKKARDKEMKEVTLELLIKSLINDFRDYQKEWLTSHNDIEFDRPEEDLILAFLDDTANSYISEHIE